LDIGGSGYKYIYIDYYYSIGYKLITRGEIVRDLYKINNIIIRAPIA